MEVSGQALTIDKIYVTHTHMTKNFDVQLDNI